MGAETAQLLERIKQLERELLIEKQKGAHSAAKKELIASEEKFRNIFESFQDLYFRVNFDGTIVMLSPSIKEIMGYDASALIGNNITNYYIYNTKIKSLLKDLIKNGSVKNFETKLVHKSGKVIPSICNIRFIRSNGVPQFIEGVARDISELKLTTQQLQHAKEVAERSLKVKERFLANMSHEIKTPLNGILGMLHLLEDDDLKPQQKRHLKSLKVSSEILMSMLNDLLDISKIEAGKMELKNTIVKTERIFEKLAILYTNDAKRQKLNLAFDIDKSVPANLLVDEIKLIQIYSNLISNAIKFTPANGSVKVKTRVLKIKKNGSLKVMAEVADNGIGISLPDSKRLFKSFTQLDSSSKKIYKGTGLGLYISKKLANMMKGRIGVKSNEDQGSTFWFTFETIGMSPATNLEQKVFPTLNGYIKIMVVDDNKVNLQLASEILKKSGCLVTTVRQGEKAVKLAKDEPFDLILMDIQMPNMDGIEATQHIKKTGLNMHTPILAMTAYSMKGDKDKYLRSGMDDYISKPIKPNILLETVQKWTKHKPQINNDLVEHKADEPFETLNKKTLAKLIEFGGEEVVKEALIEFDSECDDQLKRCDSLNVEQNFEEILNILHTLKGNAGTLGAEKLASCAEFVEDEVKKKNYHIFESSLMKLHTLHRNFKTAIEPF